MIYFTADLHLGSRKALEKDGRPFGSLQAMNETIIRRWNDVVGKKDEVYVIGDIIEIPPVYAWSSEEGREGIHPVSWYLDQMNGIKYLILGNHDEVIMRDETAKSYFAGIWQTKTIYIDGIPIVMNHYPQASWEHNINGAYMLYGHIHDTPAANWPIPYISGCQRLINVGCMLHHYRPQTFDQLKEYQEERIRSLCEAAEKELARTKKPEAKMTKEEKLRYSRALYLSAAKDELLAGGLATPYDNIENGDEMDRFRKANI